MGRKWTRKARKYVNLYYKELEIVFNSFNCPQKKTLNKAIKRPINAKAYGKFKIFYNFLVLLGELVRTRIFFPSLLCVLDLRSC